MQSTIIICNANGEHKNTSKNWKQVNISLNFFNKKHVSKPVNQLDSFKLLLLIQISIVDVILNDILN